MDQVATAIEKVEQGAHERAQWRFQWKIDKYDGEVTQEMIAAGLKPAETVIFEDNILTNAGIQRMLDFLTGAVAPGATTVLDATHTRIGVGDTTPTTGGAGTPAATDTDLQAAAGSTHRQFKLVSGAPSRSNQTVTWTASFGTAQANFAWNECGIDYGTADGTTVSGVLLNHKAISAGTKTSAQTWVATATLTIS